MSTQTLYSVSILLALSVAPSVAQQPAQEAKKRDEKPVVATIGQKNCRNISAEMRSGAPLTREIVIAELVRARAEGEMDFHISSTPPAVYRPMCELPPTADTPKAKIR
jgi:hypothetical protein